MATFKPIKKKVDLINLNVSDKIPTFIDEQLYYDPYQKFEKIRFHVLL